jgi:hypothetical protein
VRDDPRQRGDQPEGGEVKSAIAAAEDTVRKRVVFDFAVGFSNGGGLQGQGFRLDLHTDSISDAELADYLVRDMRLLMVERVDILRKHIIVEPHKR